MTIIGLLIAGVIVGLLGKLIAPGDRDNVPLWLTVLAGVVGVYLGYMVSGALGIGVTRGVDWMRWIISIAIAAVLVMVAAGATGRSRTRNRTHV